MPRCTHCGTDFPSKNKLFKHLRETGCGGGVAVIERVERYVVLYGYVGTPFHGSQFNGAAEEERCPTAEGTLLRAVEAATRAAAAPPTTTSPSLGVDADAVAGGGDVVSSCVAEVHSRSSRTDRGVHALCNAVCLRVRTELHPAAGAAPLPTTPAEGPWLRGVAAQLRRRAAGGDGLAAALTVLRRYELPSADFEARRACQKREYVYCVPYRALLSPAEREEEEAETRGDTPAAARCDASAEEEGVGEEACTVWVCDLPDACTAAQVSDFVNGLLLQRRRRRPQQQQPPSCPRHHEELLPTECPQVRMAVHVGSATLRCSTPAQAHALCLCAQRVCRPAPPSTRLLRC
jgi:tRNA pseudouridine(38-40) synthase